MPRAGDGGGTWDATRCSPVASDPGAPGELCTVSESVASGIDDCERGAMCWDVDPETLQGVCISTHTASASHQICPNPMDVPVEGASGVLLPCLARCNPLASNCGVGEGCYSVTPSRSEFVCVADVAPDQSGAAGDGCEFINVCDPGLTCINGDLVPDCDSPGCCSPFCDLDNPECPAGTDCHPWDPPVVVPGQESVGICQT